MHWIMNIFLKDTQNFIKYSLTVETLIFNYRQKNIPVSLTLISTITGPEVLLPRGQCNTRAHRAHDTEQMLTPKTSDFIAATLWPANSPDLNPVDYWISVKLQECVYHSQIHDIAQLKSKSRKISIR